MSITGHAAARYTPPMFVRIKTTPNSPRRSVQLVEGVRDRGKVRQRIVRHIGVAMDEDELERLRQLGNTSRRNWSRSASLCCLRPRRSRSR